VVVAVLLGALAGTWLGLVQGLDGRSTEAASAAPAFATSPPAHTGRAASAQQAVTSTSRAGDTVSAAQRRGPPGRAPGRDTKAAKPDQREPAGPGEHGHGKDKPKPEPEPKRQQGHD
jgi:hypothetical protein